MGKRSTIFLVGFARHESGVFRSSLLWYGASKDAISTAAAIGAPTVSVCNAPSLLLCEGASGGGAVGCNHRREARKELVVTCSRLFSGRRGNENVDLLQL